MFGFKKNIEERKEPEFEAYSGGTEQNLADILGASEHDTNITAGVDAILDEDSEISQNQHGINSQDIDFGTLEQNREPLVLDNYEDHRNYSENETSLSSTTENIWPEDKELEAFFIGEDAKFENSMTDIDNITQNMDILSEQTVTNIDNITSDEPQIIEPENTEMLVNIPVDVFPSGETVVFEDLNPSENETQDVTNVDDFLVNTDNDLSLDDILSEDKTDCSVEEILAETQNNDAQDSFSDDHLSINTEAAFAVSAPLNNEEINFSADQETVVDENSQAENKSDFQMEEEVIENDILLNHEDKTEEPDFIDTKEQTAADIQDVEPSVDTVLEQEEYVETAEETETPLEPEAVIAETEENAISPNAITSGAVTAVFNEDTENSSEQRVIDTPAHFWAVAELSSLTENPRKINSQSGVVSWAGDKYQKDIKVTLENIEEATDWSLVVLNNFSVSLAGVSSEVVIEKEERVVRYASLMQNGIEKLKIFNQRSYKFVTPQDNFFTVQGNVICGRVDSSFSLNITDYMQITVADYLNKVIRFNNPASGFITGPQGTKVFFANAQAIAFAVNAELPEAEVFEYIPSIKDFDNKSYFVFGDDVEASEFIANTKQKNLVINTGASLFGWNVRFEDGLCLSLRDVLTYQAQNHKLPSPNGEVSHGSKTLKFFGIESLKAREKTVYYSYGRI